MGLLKKLQRKEQDTLHLYQKPPELGSDWNELEAEIATSAVSKGSGTINFLLGFVLTEKEIQSLLQLTNEHRSDDCLFWIAYPKKTSKNYKAEINRDSGWEALGALSYEPVRQIAIDKDWSALRFRKVEQISKLTRNSKMILSEEGRKKKKSMS